MTIRATVLVAALGIVLAVTVVWHYGTQAGAAAVCESHLYQVAWCILQPDQQGRIVLPPACPRDASGVSVHSWRTLAAQKAETGTEFPYSFAEPWSSLTNQLFTRERPFGHLFACPEDDLARGAQCTSYVAVVGEGTLWQRNASRDLSSLGVDIGQKILFLEIPHSNIVWTEPRDISLDEAIRLFKTPNGLRHARHRKGLHFVTVTLQVRPVSSIPNVDEFRSLLCVRLNEPQGPSP